MHRVSVSSLAGVFPLLAGIAPVEAAPKNASLVLAVQLAVFAVPLGFALRHFAYVHKSEPGLRWAGALVFAVGFVGASFFALPLVADVAGPGALMPGVIGQLVPSVSIEGLKPGAVGWQLVMLTAIGCQVVAGSLAGRARLLPLALYSFVLGGFVLPIAISWTWPGGWLSAAGFRDLGGAAYLYVASGAAALAGLLILGARRGRFGSSGQLGLLPSPTLLLFGTALLWIGWQALLEEYARQAGAGLSLRPGLFEVSAPAAVAGFLVAALGNRLLSGRWSLEAMLIGSIAGLVAISAGADEASILWSLIVGAGAGVIAAVIPPILVRLRLDDATGAISAQLCTGVFSVLVLPLYASGASFGEQLVGVGAIAGFAFLSSLILFLILQVLFGLRSWHQRPHPATS